MAYSKLYSSIVHSSLWTEPDHIRILFITLFAIADREGYVDGSRKGLLRLANVNMDQCDEHDPFEALMAPDKDSSDLLRNPENEGRRIEEVPVGFRFLNVLYYRSLKNEEDRREQNKEAQRRHRSKQRSANVSHDKQTSANVIKCHKSKHISEAEAEADTEAEEKEDKEKEKPRKPIPQIPTLDSVKAFFGGSPEADKFYDHYQSNGWRVGKNPIKDWQAAARNWLRRLSQSHTQYKPTEPAPFYPKLPEKRIPTDEELAQAQRIAKEEIASLQAKLHSS